ncbi:MAG: glycosyltransferase family 4 protein [Myxococcota bacterium]
MIPVWSAAPPGDPPPRRENAYRREWEVGDRLVVMYAGNFGLAHDVRTFLQAAEALRHDDRVRFAFVGGGLRKPEVERHVRDKGLQNCIVAPYQPRERLGELLAAGDVHLVTMDPPMSGLLVPSKFYGVAAAGRACIFIGPASSEIAAAIREWGCGERVDPGAVEALVGHLRRFAEHPEVVRELGERARTGHRQHATRQVAVGKLMRLIEGA